MKARPIHLFARFFSLGFALIAFGSGCEMAVDTAQDRSSGSDVERFSSMQSTLGLTLRGQVKDEEFTQIASARIEILQIHIRRTDGAWFRFQGDAFDANLLELGESISDVLVRGLMSAGEYDEIRLITAEQGEVRLHDDATFYPLRVPSGPQTGIKLKLDDAIRVDASQISNRATLQIEIDATRSFVAIQGGEAFLFKPVVRTSVQYIVIEDDGGDGDDGDDGTTPPPGDDGDDGDDGTTPPPGDDGDDGDDTTPPPSDDGGDYFPPIVGV